ncbi:MAG: hypothetical protein R2761_22500 [Acidimicrobiales bacterium]
MAQGPDHRQPRSAAEPAARAAVQPVQRVSVVGNSGSGKSTLAARIAQRIEAPYVEIDALHHLPGWEERDPAELLADIERLTAADRWVVDGNYRRVVVEGPVWERADTVVWLALPRPVVMRQIVTRTVRRVVTRQELWNGNREPLANFYRWDPRRNIVRWSWANHAKYEARYSAAAADPRFDHLRFVVLRSHADADAWLATLTPPARPDSHPTS